MGASRGETCTSTRRVAASSIVISLNFVPDLFGQTTTSKSHRFSTPFSSETSLECLKKNRTESRRFICLIDTLYDHKIRVIASGEDDYWNLFQNEKISEQQRLEESRLLIDDLGLKAAEKGSLDSGVFSGEEELFAFDRTVSRLTEMQTKDYWKKWKSYVENR